MSEALEVPLGAVSSSNGDIPAHVWWTEVAGADAYVMQWWPSEASCDAPPDELANLHLLPTDPDVEPADCRGLSSPTGQCLSYSLNQGPWTCGAFLCLQLAAEVDGAQSGFSGALGVTTGPCE